MQQVITKESLKLAIERQKEVVKEEAKRLADYEVMLEEFSRLALAVAGKQASPVPSSTKKKDRKPSEPNPASSTAHSVRTADAKVKSAPGANETRRPRASEISNILRDLIAAQTDEFTSVRIFEQLKKQSPATAEKLPNSYVSTLLWRMTQAKQVVLVRRGSLGQPNVYANTKK